MRLGQCETCVCKFSTVGKISDCQPGQVLVQSPALVESPDILSEDLKDPHTLDDRSRLMLVLWPVISSLQGLDENYLV